MIRLCMFDMGGVVSLHQDSSMVDEIFRFLRVKDRKRGRKFIDENLDLLSSLRITEDVFWKRFTKETGFAVPDLDGKSLWGKFFHPSINKGTVDIIDRLRTEGMRVVLASNTEPPHKRYHEEMGQYDIFDAVYTSCDLRLTKPDKRFFLEILGREGVEAEDTFFVDDATENVEAAVELGIKGLLFTDATTLEAELTNLGILKKP